MAGHQLGISSQLNLQHRIRYSSNSSKSPSSSSSKSNQNIKNKPIHYFSIDNELIYWNFFLDFGPLNLGQLYRFCAKLNAKLSSPQYKDCIICYYSGAKGQARANATYLICAWSMLYLGRTLEESYFGFREEFALEGGGAGSEMLREVEGRLGNASMPPQLRLRQSLSNSSSSSLRSSSGSSSSSSSGGIHHRADDSKRPSPFARLHPLPPFHDASPIVCTYDLSVYDCLQGLDKARQFGFFKFGNTPPPSTKKSSTGNTDSTTIPTATKPPRNPSVFNADEYEYFEQVENGDLNWIVQNKILAFAGPQATKVITPEGFCMLTPADYIPYFCKQNVKLVVRLNKKCYDECDFEKVGMGHVTHYYLDGSCPPLKILHAVVSDMESIGDDQAMAVHCKAGLGRTGTCIGAYLMKHYRLTAKEVIGWMRICRPGMVIGPQQHFLADIEGLMWQEGEMMYRSNVGLRRMIISGAGDDGDEKKKAAVNTPTAKTATATVSPESIMATPQTKDKHHTNTAATSRSFPSIARVSIVTPDGKPLHLPATPVVARKLDLKRGAADMLSMIISKPPGAGGVESPSATTAMEYQAPLHSTLSSTSLPKMGALKVNSPPPDQQEQQNNEVMQEGDQANALLSRRLDQYQARQNEKR